MNSKVKGFQEREKIAETRRVCRRADGSIYGIPAGKKCRKGSEDYTTRYRVKRLTEKRDTLAKKLVEYMGQTRPDGIGTYMEHPDDKAVRVIGAVGEKVGQIDKKLNELEGKDLWSRRWVDGDPYGLSKYVNPTSIASKNYENEIAKQVLAPGQKGNKAIVIVGGPGSKKLSSSDRAVGAKRGFVVIDPEAIKAMHPVSMVGKALSLREASAMTHSSSARLAKDIYKQARAKGLNVVVNATGANPDKLVQGIRDLKGNGYKVSVLAYHINRREGIARAIAHHERTGHFSPIQYIRRSYDIIPKNFERIAREADNAIMYDVGRGRNIVSYQAGAQVGVASKDLEDFRNTYGTPSTAPVTPTTTLPSTTTIPNPSQNR